MRAIVFGLLLPALIALAACDSEKPSASEDVFQKGADETNARLDAYAQDDASSTDSDQSDEAAPDSEPPPTEPETQEDPVEQP